MLGTCNLRHQWRRRRQKYLLSIQTREGSSLMLFFSVGLIIDMMQIFPGRWRLNSEALRHGSDDSDHGRCRSIYNTHLSGSESQPHCQPQDLPMQGLQGSRTTPQIQLKTAPLTATSFSHPLPGIFEDLLSCFTLPRQTKNFNSYDVWFHKLASLHFRINSPNRGLYAIPSVNRP